MRKVNMDPSTRLGLLERFAYGMGDYSGNLVYSSISSFLLVYYVSVVGMNAAQAASIIAISKLFDGISDLIMGHLIDRTHTKWGKARPWILRICGPLAISTVLMFSVPHSLTGGLQYAYAFLTYNLVSTVGFTALNVPYATMSCLMTTDQYERGVLGNVRMLMATLGTMTVNTFVLKMCKFFGGGDEYAQRGWTITYIIMALAYAGLSMITFAFCHERVKDTGSKGNDVNPIVALKSLLKNKYWLLIVVNNFSSFLMMGVFFGAGFYFSQYALGDANSFAPISNLVSGTQVCTMFITPFIMKKVSKRNLMLAGMPFAFIGFIMPAFVGKNILLVEVASVLKGISFGCMAATIWGNLQDAITYGEWLTGVSAAGMGNAASSFCVKVGSGVGTALLGVILAAGGFNKAPESASALKSLYVSFCWVGAITTAIGTLCMVLFDLDKHYAHAVEELAAGRHKTDK